MADSTRNRSAERLIDILVELQNYGVVSRHNLMKKYNITERTAYRDLNMLSPLLKPVVMENTGLFQQEQITRTKNHCTNLWPGYWILMRFFLKGMKISGRN